MGDKAVDHDDAVGRLLRALVCRGWTISDPWSARRLADCSLEVIGMGFICPACGYAAPGVGGQVTHVPDEEATPAASTMLEPSNHAADCPMMELIKERW